MGKAAPCCAKVFIAVRDLLLPPIPSHPRVWRACHQARPGGPSFCSELHPMDLGDPYPPTRLTSWPPSAHRHSVCEGGVHTEQAPVWLGPMRVRSRLEGRHRLDICSPHPSLPRPHTPVVVHFSALQIRSSEKVSSPFQREKGPALSAPPLKAGSLTQHPQRATREES